MFLSGLDLLQFSSMLFWYGWNKLVYQWQKGISWLAGHTQCSHDPKDLNLLHVPEVKVPEQVLRESSGGWDKTDVWTCWPRTRGEHIGRLFLIISLTIQTTVPAGRVWWDDMTKSWDFTVIPSTKRTCNHPHCRRRRHRRHHIHHPVSSSFLFMKAHMFYVLCGYLHNNSIPSSRWRSSILSCTTSCLNRHEFTFPKATKGRQKLHRDT